MKISQKIAILRKRRGWSQEDLANELDVSRQSVYKWETDLAVPEINKIKKMVELFDVSFDSLLNDTIDIELGGAKAEDSEPSVNNKRGLKHRDVYISGETLSDKQADIERNSYHTPQTRKTVMENDLKLYGIDSHIILQNDMAACFIYNSKNMTFGFYFNGEVQFICPVENYIGYDLSDLGYLSPSMFVNFPWTPTTTQPLGYRLKISYFDKDGRVCEYTISLYSFKNYIIDKYQTETGWVTAMDGLSINARNSLSNICSRLNIFPVLAKKIFDGHITVDENYIEKIYAIMNSQNSFHEKCAKLEKEEKRRRDALLKERIEFMPEEEKPAEQQDSKKEKKKVFLIAAVVVIVILMLLSGC